MKEAFDAAGVITPEWTYNIDDLLGNEPVFSYPIVAKNVYGSRGTGNYKINSPEDLITWSRNRNLKNYIFEKFKNYAKEYRVHVSREGVFLVWRKLRRLDTPENQKWFFNNQNCNWVGENHELFDTPSNFNEIKEECRKALEAVGLDIGACDVRVMRNNNRKPRFSIIEINSAPSMATVTEEAYINEFIKLINK
jgi:glutathione synthase/RimK-type ligase-like ATP-grasp enzyme